MVTPVFLPAEVWHDQAEHLANSLTKGARVVATGVLRLDQ
jgi:single-stranded DNA-binding protein